MITEKNTPIPSIVITISSSLIAITAILVMVWDTAVTAPFIITHVNFTAYTESIVSPYIHLYHLQSHSLSLLMIR